MKTTTLYVVLGLLILAAIAAYYLRPQTFSADDAVSALKTAYPEYQSYPSDTLPPKSIRTQKSEDGWYVAFVQEGSGRPLIEAHCFHIDDAHNIKTGGVFKPAGVESNFDIKTCSVLQ